MKILVIGEVCEDIFIYGDVIKLCPEAPVPVFVPKLVVKNDGMAGNVLNNLKSLSNSSEIRICHQNNSILKTRFIDNKSNQMSLRIDEGDYDTIDMKLDDEIIEAINESDVVVVSDYNKGFLTDDILYKIGKKSKLSFIDTKRQITDKVAKSFTFIKVNELEYLQNQKILNKYPHKLITTLGKLGARYMDEIFESKEHKETIDVCGAGDTFLSALVIKYMETNDIKESINYANEMSLIVVSKRGVVTPYEILEDDTTTEILPSITDINKFDSDIIQ